MSPHRKYRVIHSYFVSGEMVDQCVAERATHAEAYRLASRLAEKGCTAWVQER